MTALPRNPVDVPVNPLQSQKTVPGRPGSHSSESSPGPLGEREAATSFSALMGKLPGPQQEVPLEVPSVQAQPLVSEEAPAVPNHASLQIDLEKPGALVAVSRIIEAAPLNEGQLPELSPSSSATGQIVKPSIGDLAGGQAVPSATLAGASNVQLQAGQPAPLDDLSATLPMEGRLNTPVDAKSEVKPVSLGDPAAQPAQIKIEQAVIARADLAVARPEAGPLDRRRSDPPSAPTPPRATPTAAPAQAEASARILSPQTQATPVQLESVGTPAPQSDPVSVNQSALTGAPNSSAGGSDDLPRLQDVRIKSSRVIEMAPAPSERTSQPTTVKVIDLQLQPDTLGRINAQLKQTAEGLEIRLEPSLAETAMMLKEDRLALQRILGALGSGTEPAVVRIVDPVAQREQLDGQDVVADHELDQADSGEGWSNTFDDLYDERRAGGEYQNVQLEDDQTTNSGGARRAAGDIYI